MHKQAKEKNHKVWVLASWIRVHAKLSVYIIKVKSEVKDKLNKERQECIPAGAVKQMGVCMKLFSKLQLVVAHQLVIDNNQQGFPCSKSLQTTSSPWREKQDCYPRVKVNHVSIHGVVTPWHRHGWNNMLVQSSACMRVHRKIDAASVTWSSCFASFQSYFRI